MTNKSLRVLMIDDSEIDSLLAMRHLSQAGYAPLLRREEDEAGTRAALSEERWDVLFCDSSMPGFGAAKALDLLRNMNVETPLIVVSGSTGQEAAAAAVRMGAVDWVSKQDLSRLVPVVEKYVHSGDMRPAIPEAPGAVALGGSTLHSFNNALSVVLTYASVLLNEISPENPIRADLVEIEKAASTAAALAAGLFPRPPLPLVDEGLLDGALLGKQGDEAIGEAIALVEARDRTETAPLRCEVCGSSALTAIEYRTPDLRAPALECSRCKAIKLDETVAHSVAERERVRDALGRRATVGRASVLPIGVPNGIGPSPSRAAPRALHDVCDEMGVLLADAIQRLPRTDAERESAGVSPESALRRIGELVESLRTAV